MVSFARPLVSVLFACSLVAALAAPARAGVIVVEPTQSITQISTAVGLAQDGDVILVKSGAYDGFTITNKSVSVVAEVGATVYVYGAISIADLAVTRTVVLDRLSVNNFGLGLPEGLLVQNCGGKVRVQACDFTAASGNAWIDHHTCDTLGFKDGGTAIRLQAAMDVALVSCAGYGGNGSNLWDYSCYMSSFDPQLGGDAGAGLQAVGSRAVVYDCTFLGGNAGYGSYAGEPGHGISLNSGSTVRIVNCTAAGGNGALNQDPLTAKSGGPGISSFGFSELSILDSEFHGGLSPGGQEASPGEFGAPATWWPGQAKSLGFFKLLREGQSTPIQVTGEPGDLVMLMAATKTSAITFNQFKGTFVLDPSPLFGPFVLGVIGQDILTVVVNMPQLPPALPALEVYLQALVKSAGGGSTLSSWGHLTLLDSIY